jgi:hypothetical protein
MEIVFESDDSGDEISDGDAECLFCTELSSHDKYGEKWAPCVRFYLWPMKNDVEEVYFVYPMFRGSVKL